MTLALVLRNVCKFNGAGLLRTRNFFTLKAGQTLVMMPPKQAVAKTGSSIVRRNISLTLPKRAAEHGNHTKIWGAERLCALALAGVIPAAFVYPSRPLDTLLAITAILHTHWGVEAVITDYFRVCTVGPKVRNFMHLSLFLLSVTSLGGLFYFIYNDIGIAKTVKEFWAIEGMDPEDLKKLLEEEAKKAEKAVKESK